MFKKGKNYKVSFLLCVSLSAMSWSPESAAFLISSDVNVLIWLFIAWFIDPKQQ